MSYNGLPQSMPLAGIPHYAKPRLWRVILAGPVSMGLSTCGRYVVGKGLRSGAELPIKVDFAATEAEARELHKLLAEGMR